MPISLPVLLQSETVRFSVSTIASGPAAAMVSGGATSWSSPKRVTCRSRLIIGNTCSVIATAGPTLYTGAVSTAPGFSGRERLGGAGVAEPPASGAVGANRSTVLGAGTAIGRRRGDPWRWPA